MKKFIFTLALASFFSTPAFALMAPFYTTAREFNAVIENKDLATHFSPNDKLTSIERQGNTFTVKAGEKTVFVDLVYSPTSRIGPREFTLKVRDK